jgi:hypothetical protein
MFKNFSPGLFFSMTAVTVCIFTPFIMLFHPVFYSLIFTDSFSTFIPSPIYKRIILIGSLLVAGTLGLLAYKRNKSIYAISSVLFIAGVGMWYFSIQNHISINENHIVKQAFFSKYQYEWNEFTDIVYEYEKLGNKGDYTFTTETGEQFIIKEKELRSDGQLQIYNYAVSHNIPFTERSK